LPIPRAPNFRNFGPLSDNLIYISNRTINSFRLRKFRCPLAGRVIWCLVTRAGAFPRIPIKRPPMRQPGIPGILATRQSAHF